MGRSRSDKAITVPFTILVDGREKAPYTFQGLIADARHGRRRLVVPTRWAHLRTGDYTIEGMERLVAIERKSPEDLYGSLGSRRERFEEEHRRLSEMAFACVVIEADWRDLLDNPPPRSRLNPKCVWRTALSWPIRYGVPWYTYSDRRMAEVATFRMLEKCWWFFHKGA